MISNLCIIFLFLIGATVSSLIAWLLCLLFCRSVKSKSSSVILGLTESSERALGECAKPDQLRQMQPESIKRLLDKYQCETNEKPDEKYYDKWPEQAELICCGQYSLLKQKQNDWQHSDPDGGCNDKENLVVTSTCCQTVLLVLFLLFLILSGLAYFLSDCTKPPNCPTGQSCLPPPDPIPPNCPAGQSCLPPPDPIPPNCPAGQSCLPPPAPVACPVKVSADDFFNYKLSTLKNEANAIERGKVVLSQYENDLKIISIKTFTDPIGGSCSNQELAKKRADEIKRITGKVLKEENRDLGNLDEIITSGDGPEMSQQAQNIWKDCLTKFKNKKDAQGRLPLKLYTPDNTDYKNCDLKKVEQFENAFGNYRANRRSNVFPELEQCLEELRVVEFVLEGTKKPMPPLQVQPKN